MFTFNEDNFLYIILSRIWDIVLVNVLFILCSIPIITIGPAFTAMHHVTLRIVKGNNPGTFKTFFRAFKENFRQSFVVWIVSLLAIFVFISNIQFLESMNSSFASFLYYATIIFLIFVIVFNLYVHPVIAAFEGNLKSLMKNAILFIFMKIPYALIMFVIWAFPLYLACTDTGLQPLYAFCWSFFGFGTIAYINSTMLYKLFKPYLPEDEEEITADLDFRIE